MTLNLYGLLIALGVLAGVFVMSREAKRLSLPQDLALDLALWAVPLAVVFSRVYYVIFSWETYRNDLLGILRFWEGGLAIYGGIIGGTLGIYLLSRRRKLPFPQLLDLMAPAVILGQAIGRWGNFFNGEAYGRQLLNPAWQFFPLAVKVGEHWHLATFFYESLWNLLGFILLQKLKDRAYKIGHGILFLCYLLWYGFGRMVIEGLRTDSLMLGSLRVSQVLSLVLLSFSGILILWRMKRFIPGLPVLVIGLGLLLLAALGKAGFLVPAYLVFGGYVILTLAIVWRGKGENAA